MWPGWSAAQSGDARGRSTRIPLHSILATHVSNQCRLVLTQEAQRLDVMCGFVSQPDRWSLKSQNAIHDPRALNKSSPVFPRDYFPDQCRAHCNAPCAWAEQRSHFGHATYSPAIQKHHSINRRAHCMRDSASGGVVQTQTCGASKCRLRGLLFELYLV